MTKKELVDSLKEQMWFDGVVVEPVVNETKPDGSKQCIMNVREVNGDVARYYNVFFYVVDEGKETERAFWQEKEPEKTIAEKVVAEVVA